MDDVQEAVQLEANLTALPDNPTEEQIVQATKGFRGYSVSIAMYKLLQASGGGGGGSSWLGPAKLNAFADQEISDSQGTADGGTYTLTIGVETTDPIAWDATTVQLQSALEALPSIGQVAVTAYSDPASITEGYDIGFGAMGISGPVVGDASSLTGPDEPYTIVSGGVSDVPFELATLAVGNVLQDILVVIPQPFDTGVYVRLADNASNSFNRPNWSPADAADTRINLDTPSTYNHFASPAQSGPTSAMTQGAAKWVADGSVNGVILPAVVTSEVTIYAYLKGLPAPVQTGEAWFYFNVGQTQAL